MAAWRGRSVKSMQKHGMSSWHINWHIANIVMYRRWRSRNGNNRQHQRSSNANSANNNQPAKARTAFINIIISALA